MKTISTIHTLLIILSYFQLIVRAQECGCQSPSPSPSSSQLLTFLAQRLAQECGCQSPSPSPSSSQLLTFLDQRLAQVYPIIQTFKNTITSDPFNVTQTWIGSDICNYKGFICDHPPDNLSAIAVAGIDFNGFRLTAPSLDGFIDLLPDLAIFHANTNNFSGTISSKIAQLQYLYEFDISNNNFFGEFPGAVLGISGLTFLDIRYNFFNGSIPHQVFMKTLDVLFLNNNNFMQALPITFGLTTAQYLTLANNKFTGSIPKSIGNTSITEILFLNNLLTGCLPYELGLLKELTVLDVGNNLLTGPLPCSLGCLANAEILNLASNFFYGQIPEAVCEIGSLTNLSLSNNYFTKVGPNCLKLIKSGIVDVRKNCIHGVAHQRPLRECAHFFIHHPRFCPYEASSFSVIPCKLHSFRDPSSVGSNRPASVTYPALLGHLVNACRWT